MSAVKHVGSICLLNGARKKKSEGGLIYDSSRSWRAGCLFCKNDGHFILEPLHFWPAHTHLGLSCRSLCVEVKWRWRKTTFLLPHPSHLLLGSRSLTQSLSLLQPLHTPNHVQVPLFAPRSLNCCFTLALCNRLKNIFLFHFPPAEICKKYPYVTCCLKDSQMSVFTWYLWSNSIITINANMQTRLKHTQPIFFPSEKERGPFCLFLFFLPLKCFLSFLHSAVCPLSCLPASQRCFFHSPAPLAIPAKLSHNCPTCHVCWMCEQSLEGARQKRPS